MQAGGEGSDKQHAKNDKGKEQLQGEREREGGGEKRKGSKVGAQQQGSSREQSGLVIIKL